MKYFSCLLLAVLTSLNLFAQDFSYEYEGHTITYTIISESDRICQTKSGERDWETGVGFTGNPEAAGKLIIPEVAINGDTSYKVVGIGDESFSFSKVTSVTIPSSVTSIGNYAFLRCRYLKKVSIDNSKVGIGDHAFQECSALNSIDLGDKLITIGNSVFKDCTSLPSITIPTSILAIENNTFEGCTNLKSVNLGESVNLIGDSAFYGCQKLTSITIPNSVESIGNFAFYACLGLKEAILGESVKLIGQSAFHGTDLKSVNIQSSSLTVKEDAFLCRNLERAEFLNIESLCAYKFANVNANPLNYAHHLFINGEEITDLVIPNEVTSIEDYVFRSCYYLTSIKMADTVTSIGAQAFCYCSGIQNITLSQNLNIIGNYAFNDCSSMTSLIIPNSVRSIGNSAFSGCGLTSIVIPCSISYIGENAFKCNTLKEILTDPSNPHFYSRDGVLYDKNITQIVAFPNGKDGEYVIPNSISVIEDNCFYGANINSITIPNSVTRIGKSAFSCCTNLVSLTIPDSVIKIGEEAFAWCDGLTSVLIASPETTILENSFKGCWNLKKVAIPMNCQFPGSADLIMWYTLSNIAIENGIIYNLDKTMILFAPTNLEDQYMIPSTINSINGYAFGWCTKLTSVVIPISVTNLEAYAFVGCDKLSSVYYNCTEPIEITDGPVFGDNIDEATLYVPAHSIDKCTKIEPWKNFKNIQAYDFSGVETLSEDINFEEFYEVYTPSGIRVGNNINDLKTGFYILYQKNKIKKIYVK